MSFTEIQNIKKLNIEETNNRIKELKIEILNLKIQKATKQNIKPHIFKHKKRELAQLLTARTEKINLTSNDIKKI